jgi:hypothetical protein
MCMRLRSRQSGTTSQCDRKNLDSGAPGFKANYGPSTSFLLLKCGKQPPPIRLSAGEVRWRRLGPGQGWNQKSTAESHLPQVTTVERYKIMQVYSDGYLHWTSRAVPTRIHASDLPCWSFFTISPTGSSPTWSVKRSKLVDRILPVGLPLVFTKFGKLHPAERNCSFHEIRRLHPTSVWDLLVFMKSHKLHPTSVWEMAGVKPPSPYELFGEVDTGRGSLQKEIEILWS